MKRILLIVSLVVVGGSLRAQDFTARQRHALPPQKAPIVIPAPPVDGAVQKAARTGNPLQMLNPFAPREYGNGSECVYHDQDDYFQDHYNHAVRPKGIRLFSFRW